MFYFAFFNSSLRIKNSDNLYKIAPANVTITGQIKSIPNSNVKDKTKFYFQVSSIEYKNKTVKDVNSKVLVTVKSNNEDFSNLKIGNYYKLEGALRKPFKAGNPSQFDYGRYLRNFNTFSVFYTKTSDITLLEYEKNLNTKFLQGLNDLRTRIISTHSNYLKSPNLEILGGIIFGDDAVAPPDYIKASFINSGLLHILAASGMNVAFIYGFWYFTLTRLKVPYKFILLSGIAMVTLYSLMTGLGASVIRATFMLIFILLGKLINRDRHSVALLSLVALLMLIYNPAYINEVGFQLSFLVTFGLLITVNIVLDKFKKIPQAISSAIFIPIIAQAWVIPIQMFYFNNVSVYSVFANILILPFLSIVSFLGFLSSVLSIFEPISNFICKYSDMILNPLLNVIVFISNYFSGLKNSLLITTHPHVLQVLMYYSIILLITLLLKIGFRNRKIILLTLILAISLLLSTIQIPSENLEIIIFDVQNADAFLIKTPKNKYFMIDTGKGSYDGGTSQAKAIIIKYMRDYGIKNLEGLIITHFDNDHSGGVIDILENIQVKTIYINDNKNKTLTARKIYNRLEKENSKIAKHKEEIYKENDFKITTYRKTSPKNENENSIITLLTYNEINILMMGDASMNGLKDLPANIQIIKIGHHGARSVVDTNLLKTLNSEVSIVSTGFNTFGHPSPLTLKELKSTKIYRTDKQNSIKITSDSHTYDISTYDINKNKYIRQKP